jgi:NAD(P)-dependent dehydrogenase (short-subunit alcohol dehydrogenase family)
MRAVITGGRSGISLAVAASLHASGHDVVVVSHSEPLQALIAPGSKTTSRTSPPLTQSPTKSQRSTPLSVAPGRTRHLKSRRPNLSENPPLGRVAPGFERLS